MSALDFDDVGDESEARDLSVPPHSDQAEEAVLGSVLKHPPSIAKVADWLGVEDLHAPRHRHIWRAMLSLRADDMPIDYHSVGDRLRQLGVYEAAGGMEYLSQLNLATPTAAFIDHYASIVQRTSRMRQVISRARTIAEVAFRDDRNAAEVLDVELAKLSNILSAARGGATERKLSFHTARDVAQDGPEHVPWRVKPWIADGAITELDGKVKQAGKTTWLLAAIRASLDGEPFMGQPTGGKAPVVLLTEQGKQSLRAALRRAGLVDRDDLHILYWHEASGIPWPQVVDEAATMARQVGAQLLAVDTLSQFVGLHGDAENNSGDALSAVGPLQQVATRDGLAVVFTRHERKSGGDVGDSGRGSSAFAGAVDIVLSLRRAEGNSRPTLRVLHALSRFDETPDRLVIELLHDRYAALGEEDVLAVEVAKTAVCDALPPTADTAKNLNELLEVAAVKRTVAQEALNQLVATGAVRRLGAGKRGDRYRWYRASEDEKSFLPRYIGEVAAERNDGLCAVCHHRPAEGDSALCHPCELRADTSG
ncbi:MAG: AAA family ATPase [Chloroflexi bacterium]|nr:AAA family ATPase [Chloroflexota bacterium]